MKTNPAQHLHADLFRACFIFIAAIAFLIYPCASAPLRTTTATLSSITASTKTATISATAKPMAKLHRAAGRPPSCRRHHLPHAPQCDSHSVAIRARWRMERANLHARLPQPAPRPRRPQSLLLDLRPAAHLRRRHAAARPLHFQRRPASCRIPCQFQRSTQPGKIHRRRARLLAGSKFASRSPTFNPHLSTTFRPEYLQSLIFYQGSADNIRHTLIVDEIRVADAPAPASSLSAPADLRATGYDRHVELEWNSADPASSLPLRNLSLRRRQQIHPPSAPDPRHSSLRRLPRQIRHPRSLQNRSLPTGLPRISAIERSLRRPPANSATTNCSP